MVLIRFKALNESFWRREREREEREVQRDRHRHREKQTNRQTEREWEVKSLNSKLNMFLQRCGFGEEEQRTKNSSSGGIEKIETLLLRTTALEVLKSCQ
jgi:hypothetical protein